MNADLQTIERLRPEPEALDPRWSAQVVGDILAQPTRHRRRHGGRVAAGAAALVLATAGGAYAAGLIPEFITDGLNQVSTGDVSSQKLLADVSLPDGRRVGIWAAKDEHGDRCRAIAEDWNGRNASPAAAFECGPNTPRVDALWSSGSSDPEQGDPPAYLIVYGQSPSQSARSVHIVGNNIELRTPVDPSTGGFGTRIPIPLQPITQAQAPMLTLNFLDRNGTAMASIVLKDD
jgi:hypothetical protein